MEGSPPSRDLGEDSSSRGQCLYGRPWGESSKPEATKPLKRQLLRSKTSSAPAMAHFHVNEQLLAHFGDSVRLEPGSRRPAEATAGTAGTLSNSERLKGSDP